MSKLLCWLGLFVAIVPGGAIGQQLNPGIPTQSDWIVLQQRKSHGPFTMFRRYSFTASGFPNLLIFNCSREPRKTFSHLTLIVPKDYEIASFSRDAWQPKLQVRLLIDDQRSLSAEVEYQSSEFYLDFTPANADLFQAIWEAQTLAIGFGDKNDIVRFDFTPKMDLLMRDAVKKTDIAQNLGPLRIYNRSEALSACRATQR